MGVSAQAKGTPRERAVALVADAMRERQRMAVQDPADPLYHAVKMTTWFIDKADELAEVAVAAMQADGWHRG